MISDDISNDELVGLLVIGEFFHHVIMIIGIENSHFVCFYNNNSSHRIEHHSIKSLRKYCSIL
jgi:hypothetical protein